MLTNGDGNPDDELQKHQPKIWCFFLFSADGWIRHCSDRGSSGYLYSSAPWLEHLHQLCEQLLESILLCGWKGKHNYYLDMSMHNISGCIFIFSATIPNDLGHCEQFIASCGTKTKGNCLFTTEKHINRLHYVTVYSIDDILCVNTSGDHRQTAGHEVPAPAL